MPGSKIINVRVRDVRFPTSLEQHGSDAMVRFLWDSLLWCLSVILFTNNALQLVMNVIRSTRIRITPWRMLFLRRTRNWRVMAWLLLWEEGRKSVSFTNIEIIQILYVIWLWCARAIFNNDTSLTPSGEKWKVKLLHNGINMNMNEQLFTQFMTLGKYEQNQL